MTREKVIKDVKAKLDDCEATLLLLAPVELREVPVEDVVSISKKLIRIMAQFKI